MCFLVSVVDRAGSPGWPPPQSLQCHDSWSPCINIHHYKSRRNFPHSDKGRKGAIPSLQTLSCSPLKQALKRRYTWAKRPASWTSGHELRRGQVVGCPAPSPGSLEGQRPEDPPDPDRSSPGCAQILAPIHPGLNISQLGQKAQALALGPSL